MSLSSAASAATGQWTMDATSGTEPDTIGSNDAAERSGSTVGSAAGKFDNARVLVRADSDGLEVADGADIPVGDIDFTYVIWFYLDDVVDNQAILDKASAENASYFATYRSGSQKIEWEVYSGSGFSGKTSVLTTDTVSAEAWHLLCVKHDAANNIIGVSLDGAAFDTAAHSTGIYDGSETLKLGWDNFGSWFGGMLDDGVMIKNYAFTDQDAADLWDSGTGVAFADWTGGGGGETGAISEGMEAGDTQTAVAMLAAAISEGLEAGETWAANLAALATQTEGAVAGDSVDVIATLQAALSEGSKAGDTFAGILTALAAISEGVSVGETFAGVVGGTTGAISDGAEAGDTQASRIDAAALLSEGAETGDTFANRLDGIAIWTEGVRLGDAWTSRVARLAAWAESVWLSDAWIQGGGVRFPIGFVAGLVYQAGFQAGKAYQPGFQAGDVVDG